MNPSVFKFQIFFSAAVWPYTKPFPSWGLSLLICRMGPLNLASLDYEEMMDAKQRSSSCLLPQH